MKATTPRPNIAGNMLPGIPIAVDIVPSTNVIPMVKSTVNSQLYFDTGITLFSAYLIATAKINEGINIATPTLPTDLITRVKLVVSLSCGLHLYYLVITISAIV